MNSNTRGSAASQMREAYDGVYLPVIFADDEEVSAE